MDRGEPTELGNLHDIIYPEVFGNESSTEHRTEKTIRAANRATTQLRAKS
jgi:hypothetical protein